MSNFFNYIVNSVKGFQAGGKSRNIKLLLFLEVLFGLMIVGLIVFLINIFF